MELDKIYNEDCQEGIKCIPDASIDCILTDPPYLYLKGQKLERPFDEHTLFNEFKRVLKPSGFVILFGRGTSFYRWNTILSDLGFKFKEEIIWDKSYTTSPMHPLSRCHETISIYSNGAGIISNRIPYLEMKGGDLQSISQDLKRIKSALNNPFELSAIEKYLNSHIVDYNGAKKKGYNTTIQGVSKEQCRSVKTLQAITEGMKEKSIITVKREHYGNIHPTQKPIRLLERLLALTTNLGDLILDPFSGSCSTAVACINTNRKYIGFEVDKEFYDAGIRRLNEVLSEPKLAM